MLTRLRRLRDARGALAGIEFALVLPVLLAMLAGMVDITLAVITGRRLTIAAADVALIASTMAVQASNPNVLTGQQAWQATTAPFAIFQNWRNSGGSVKFSITLSAVNFTGSPAGCSTTCSGYVAATKWSVANPAGQIALRPCGSLAAAPNGSDPSMSTVPAGVFGPTPVLLGDVSTVFIPLMTGVFIGPLTMLRSAYIPPRANKPVQLASSGPAQTVICN